MDVVAVLFPKRLRRKRKTKRLRKIHRKFLKRSATVRDLDVIHSKLSSYPATVTRNRLLNTIKKSRKDAVVPAIDVAKRARKVPVPQPKIKDLSEPKLQNRFGQVVGKLTARVNKRLPIALKDPSNVDDLHKLRIDSKRLRYALEMAAEEKPSQLLEVLRSWQDVLGSVHDWDVTIEYLKGLKKSPEMNDYLTNETTKRKEHYEKFVELCKERPGAKIPS
jgi:CHAD domain-containing protein